MGDLWGILCSLEYDPGPEHDHPIQGSGFPGVPDRRRDQEVPLGRLRAQYPGCAEIPAERDNRREKKAGGTGFFPSPLYPHLPTDPTTIAEIRVQASCQAERV